MDETQIDRESAFTHIRTYYKAFDRWPTFDVVTYIRHPIHNTAYAITGTICQTMAEATRKSEEYLQQYNNENGRLAKKWIEKLRKEATR